MNRHSFAEMITRFAVMGLPVILCLFLVGCAATELALYDNPVPAEGQASTLLIPSGIKLYSVDGKKGGFMRFRRNTFFWTPLQARTLLLSSGDHEIHFQLCRSIWVHTRGYARHSHEISFRTEPGKTYRLAHMVIESEEEECLLLKARIDERLAGGQWKTLPNSEDVAPLVIEDENWEFDEQTQIFRNYDPAQYPNNGLLVFSSSIENKSPPYPFQLTLARIREVNSTFVPDSAYSIFKRPSFLSVVMYESVTLRNLITGERVDSFSPGDPIPEDQIIGQVHAITLPAGIYSSMSFYRNVRTEFRTPLASYIYQEKHNRPHCASFNIEPGKVTYIGNIVIITGEQETAPSVTTANVSGKTLTLTVRNQSSTLVTFEIRDKQSRDMAIFAKSYPNLKDQPVLRNLLW